MIFGILAIVRSERLVQAGSASAKRNGVLKSPDTPKAQSKKEQKENEDDEEGEANDVKLVTSIFQELLDLSTKKSFVIQLAYQAIISFLDQVNNPAPSLALSFALSHKHITSSKCLSFSLLVVL